MRISCLTQLAFLVCFLTSAKPYGTFGFNIKLIPMDRFDTTLFPHNLTQEERYQRISLISRARVRQLESKACLGSFDQKMPEEHDPNTLKPLTTRHHIGYYITTVVVGTYAYTPFLVVDTASDDTWMQCEGCTHCFGTAIGNFNRSRSRSYSLLAYDHPLCVPNLRINDSCAYDISYDGNVGSNIQSKGQVGSDTFTFKDGASSIKEFPNTVFGCGLENYNMGWAHEGENNTISGIFGLTLGVRSILSQYKSETKRRISYCLPSWTSPDGTYTMLQFGDDARISGRPGVPVRTTTLIQNFWNVYAVNITGIRISGKRLSIDPKVFRLRSNGTGGFLIDTGSPHTVLVQAAYDVVKGEIIRYFLDRYSWHPSPRRPERMDLCYDVPHGSYLYPTMMFHFSGTYLFLDYKNVFHFFRGGFCLVIMPTHDGGTSVLGAFQQANFRFLFDFRAYTASFVPEECRFHEESNDKSTRDTTTSSVHAIATKRKF